MPSIVLELQRDVLDSSVSVSDLLRKALLIATKLDIPEFKSWIENELSGYRSESVVPPYRESAGTLMGQDRWGRWLPVLFSDSKLEEMIAKFQFVDAVTEIEAIIERTKRDKDAGNAYVDFTPEQQQILRNTLRSDAVRHTRFIRREDLFRVLNAVRNEILKWSLKLEKEGVLGEGMTFSRDERRKASEIHYSMHFHSPVGNVSQHAERVNQSANVGVPASDLAKLIAEMNAHLSELHLDSRQERRAEMQLEILKSELNDPDPEIVKQAGQSLRNITEGAIGSLLANAAAQPGVWHWIHQVLSSF
jgi:hypothetical protein